MNSLLLAYRGARHVMQTANDRTGLYHVANAFREATESPERTQAALRGLNAATFKLGLVQSEVWAIIFRGDSYECLRA